MAAPAEYRRRNLWPDPSRDFAYHCMPPPGKPPQCPGSDTPRQQRARRRFVPERPNSAVRPVRARRTLLAVGVSEPSKPHDGGTNSRPRPSSAPPSTSDAAMESHDPHSLLAGSGACLVTGLRAMRLPSQLPPPHPSSPSRPASAPRYRSAPPNLVLNSSLQRPVAKDVEVEALSPPPMVANPIGKGVRPPMPAFRCLDELAVVLGTHARGAVASAMRKLLRQRYQRRHGRHPAEDYILSPKPPRNPRVQPKNDVALRASEGINSQEDQLPTLDKSCNSSPNITPVTSPKGNRQVTILVDGLMGSSKYFSEGSASFYDGSFREDGMGTTFGADDADIPVSRLSSTGSSRRHASFHWDWRLEGDSCSVGSHADAAESALGFCSEGCQGCAAQAPGDRGPSASTLKRTRHKLLAASKKQAVACDEKKRKASRSHCSNVSREDSFSQATRSVDGSSASFCTKRSGSFNVPEIVIPTDSPEVGLDSPSSPKTPMAHAMAPWLHSNGNRKPSRPPLVSSFTTALQKAALAVEKQTVGIKAAFHDVSKAAQQEVEDRNRTLEKWELVELARSLALDVKEVRAVKDCFDKMDTDGNGQLTFEEYARAISLIFVCDEAEDQDFKVDNMMQIWHDSDKNRDGHISFNEFLEYYARGTLNLDAMLSHEERQMRQLGLEFNITLQELDFIKHQFELYDTNNSGEIDIEEFELVLNRLVKVPPECSLPAARIKRFFCEIRLKGCGGVTFEQFVAWWVKRRDDLMPYQNFYRNVRPVHPNAPLVEPAHPNKHSWTEEEDKSLQKPRTYGLGWGGHADAMETSF